MDNDRRKAVVQAVDVVSWKDECRWLLSAIDHVLGNQPVYPRPQVCRAVMHHCVM